MGLIDLHAHVLPGVDDGPKTATESLTLLKHMADQGVTTVVASAHAFDGRYNVSRDQVLRRTTLLQTALAESKIAVHLLPSLEYTMSPDLVLAARRRELLPIGNGQWVVVELPRGDLPFFLVRTLEELAQAGYTPILNHPERHPMMQADPARAWCLIENGALIMVTASSLVGEVGKRAAAMAGELVQCGGNRVLIVSDAHDLTRRPPLLPEALEVARRLGKADQSAEWSLFREEGNPCTTTASDS